MTIRITSMEKGFLKAGRSRLPFYRQLLNMHGNRHRPTVNVLKDVNLEIPDGSRVAIIGPNGAGKTTLLRLIAGIYKPTNGNINVDGRVCCFLSPGAGAAPTLPVLDNIYLYGALAGMSHRETTASMSRILEFSSLTEQKYSWVEHLSFGMQQRLFMAIQLETMRINRAEVFLFDEFLMGVDKPFRSRVVNALTEFPSGRQIVLHASHDHELLLRTCPTALCVDELGIKYSGPTAQVLEQYTND